MFKYFLYKWTHFGFLETKVFSVIPLVLYFSVSKIRNPKEYFSGGVVYAMHITPWLTIGINGPSRHAVFEHKTEIRISDWLNNEKE